MAQPAFLQETLEARLVTGRVVRAGDDVFRVLADGIAHEASLAASCLLEPGENDVVLLACLENGGGVIVSVLFRDEAATARVRLPLDSNIECPGKLALRGGSSLDLHSGDTLSLASQDLRLSSHSATANILRLNTMIDTADLCCRALTTLGQTAVSAFRTVTQCLGESRKMVEGDDETHCANATLVAGENATTMSKNALTLAEDTSRTDAKLIQLG